MGRVGRRIAFATSAALPDSTADDRLVVDALRSRGVEAIPAVWDSSDVPWASFGMTIVRSTWDYQHRCAEFLRWVDRVASGCPLWNPASTIRWNHDKRYLIDLLGAGHAVVPTERVVHGSTVTLRSLERARGWDAVVVKPAIGAGGHNVQRFGPAEIAEGEAHLARLLRAGDALVQPFLETGRELGERSLVFLGGTFSHAVEHPPAGSGDRKVPRPLIPSRSDIEQAGRIVAGVSPVPLYTRLDFLPDGQGAWLLGELELIEPELFFRCSPGAADHFADLIVRKLAVP